MHDIKFIKRNPEIFDNSLLKRNLKPLSKIIIKVHDDYLLILSKLQKLQEQRNSISKKIGIKSQQGNHDEIEELKKEVLIIKENSNILIEKSEKKKKEIDSIIINIPNLLDDLVPTGNSEKDNIVIKKIGDKKDFKFKVKDHVILGEELNIIDYNQASKISGSRFSVLKSELALLNRALINFMLDSHTKNSGYQEIVVPELVKSSTLFGTGQLPKFKDDLFQTSNDLWLIPTAEVCLTNLYRDEIIDDKNLPLRFTSYTNCFRSEAGSAGLDTKGLIREHQFGKVELVSVTEPSESMNELERMVNCIKIILDKLNLPYRLLKLCSTDIGFAASYTLDFEVWMPGQKKYREVSSCSNCKDFQSRRMLMRAKNKQKNEIFFPHTLNGSGLAIGRILVAILENYQQEDGSVSIPDVLKNYMNGIAKIERNVR